MRVLRAGIATAAMLACPAVAETGRHRLAPPASPASDSSPADSASPVDIVPPSPAEPERKRAVPRPAPAAPRTEASRKDAAQRVAAARRRVSQSIAHSADRARYLALDAVRPVLQGCPPVLQSGGGCTFSSRAAALKRTLFGSPYTPRLFGLAHYRDGAYRYVDGYLLREGASGEPAGWIPLLGGALSPGRLWPEGYPSFRLPAYLVDYFDLGETSHYRFADNVVYRIADDGAAITAIAALLTGDRFSIGDRLPRGYDVYNVPLPYRTRYPDSAEVTYRYSDGRVYRIDPATGLIQGADDLLA